MAAVPEAAVERLRRLEAKVEGWRAGYRELQDGFQHARAEAGRLEGLLQGMGGGRRLEVDEQGRVFTREARGFAGVRRTVGLVSTPDPVDGPREVPRYIEDSVVDRTGRDIARLRREAADLSRRRDELAERLHPVSQLAAACRTELEARGWRETEYATVAQPTTLSVRGAA